MLNIEDYRALYPGAERQIYVNNAGVGLPSTRAIAAANRWFEDLLLNGASEESDWEVISEGVRAAAARLIGATPAEIAFTRNTSHGLGLIAEGLSWQPGDEVAVCASIEYPSVVYPWQHLADKGVLVREIEPEDGGVTVEGVRRALTARTRLVAVSSVQYATGIKTDLEAIGKLCAERGVFLCVDGIQSVGAFPIDVKEARISFLSADSHKWLLGFSGIGILYIDEKLLPQVRPSLVGWKSTSGGWDFDRADFELRADAAKFEEGSASYGLIYGLGACLEIIEEIGVPNIAAHIGGLLDYLTADLQALGLNVSPTDPAKRAGIITAALPDEEQTVALYNYLHTHKVGLSLRRKRLRISPHLFNNRADMDGILAASAAFLRENPPAQAKIPEKANRQ